GAALALQRAVRQGLEARPERQEEVVAGDGRAPELVERRAEDGVEVRVRSGEEVVVRPLQPGAVARLCRVADDVGEQRAGRVTAKVQRLAADLRAHVRGEDRAAVRRVDLS